VFEASVTVGETKVSQIQQGLAVLVGIHREDTDEDMEFIIRKILNLRLFDADNGKAWAHNVVEKNYDVLLVSQFTLMEY